MKSKLLIVTIFIGLMTGCNDSNDDLNPINFTKIGQNNLYGNGQENITQQNLIISDLNSWNDLLTKMDIVNDVSSRFTETDIAFDEFIVIAVFDEIKGNGGHSIDIVKVRENENQLIVTIENVLKGDATTVMTQPFHIVKIQKTNKLIIFD